jgi:uncharacterized membrane protein HdeD (DUF308 family)
VERVVMVPEPTSRELGRLWLLPVVDGSVSLIVGLLALVLPRESLATIAVLLGVGLVLLGGLRVATALFVDEPGSPRLAGAAIGAIAMLAGVLVIARPGGAVTGVAIVIGCWSIVVGAVVLSQAVVVRTDRWLNLARAVVDIGVGVLLVAWPDIALTTLAVVAGLYLMWRGAIEIALGVTLRRAAQ